MSHDLPSITAPSPELALQLLANAPYGVLMVDETGRVAFANEAMLGLTGLPTAALIGLMANELTLPAPLKVLRLADSEARFYPAAAAEGLAAQAPGHAAGPDWLAFLEYEASRCRRYGKALSLLVLRLEPATPEIEQAMAVHLRERLRWADLIGRDGRGEFVVILPETGAEALPALGAKLLVGAPGSTLHLGQACWRRGDDALRLLRRARAALIPVDPVLADAALAALH